MTTLTVVRGGIVLPAPPVLKARCDDHSVYVAGCQPCKERNAERMRQRRKAVILGVHQPGMVSSIGAARRLQALCLAGYPAVDIAARMQVHRDRVRDWRAPLAPLISRRRHNDIVALTRQLDGIPGPSRRARTIAHREGWQPLAAWDDIDNADEIPQVRSEAHQRDGRVLIDRVLAGKASIDVLTATEQARLWRRWVEQRQQDNQPTGPKSFGRAFDISPHRAERIIAAGRTSTDPSITDRKVA